MSLSTPEFRSKVAIFGLLAGLFNYVPYIGPALMVLVLFGVGLVTFSSLAHALIAPLGLVALTTLEGHVVTPSIIGRRLTLNPLCSPGYC